MWERCILRNVNSDKINKWNRVIRNRVRKNFKKSVLRRIWWRRFEWNNSLDVATIQAARREFSFFPRRPNSSMGGSMKRKEEKCELWWIGPKTSGQTRTVFLRIALCTRVENVRCWHCRWNAWMNVEPESSAGQVYLLGSPANALAMPRISRI